MGRPSKLTDAQWEKIGKRLLAGESTSALGREYGISKTAISLRFSKRIETVRAAAGKLLEAEEIFGKLNVSEQFAARTLADELRGISLDLARAGGYGARTAHRLSGMANLRVDKLDDENPEVSRKAYGDVAALTKLANDASEIGLNLMRANKEAVDGLNKVEALPAEPKQIVFTVADASA